MTGPESHGTLVAWRIFVRLCSSLGEFWDSDSNYVTACACNETNLMHGSCMHQAGLITRVYQDARLTKLKFVSGQQAKQIHILTPPPPCLHMCI
jgi:hypothetical protein